MPRPVSPTVRPRLSSGRETRTSGRQVVASPVTGPVLDAVLVAVVAVSGLFALARRHLGVLAGLATSLVSRLRVWEDEDGTARAVRFER